MVHCCFTINRYIDPPRIWGNRRITFISREQGNKGNKGKIMDSAPSGLISIIFRNGQILGLSAIRKKLIITQQSVMYVYFFIKCVVRRSENSVRFENLMGIGFQMGQIL